MNDPLPVLYERGLLTDLDLHFARFMSRLASDPPLSRRERGWG